jgi:hypothetical protein
MRPFTFTLVVDDFGIKYVGKEHADYLLNALKQDYEVTSYWTGKLYCGIKLDWDYKNQTMDLSMPGYIESALHKFQRKEPAHPHHAPFPARTPQYGSKVQLTPHQDTSPALTPAGKKQIHHAVGSLLYYGRAIYPTILTAITILASQQATTTEDMSRKLLQLINYRATDADAKMRYTASNMILKIQSDAGYMKKSEARSRADGFFFMISKPNNEHNSTMVPYLPCQQFSTRSWPVQPRQKWALYFKMQRKESTFGTSLHKWAIRSLQRPYRCIIQPYTTHCAAHVKNSAVGQLTCDSTGYAIAHLGD